MPFHHHHRNLLSLPQSTPMLQCCCVDHVCFANDWFVNEKLINLSWSNFICLTEINCLPKESLFLWIFLVFLANRLAGWAYQFPTDFIGFSGFSELYKNDKWLGLRCAPQNALKMAVWDWWIITWCLWIPTTMQWWWSSDWLLYHLSNRGRQWLIRWLFIQLVAYIAQW